MKVETSLGTFIGTRKQIQNLYHIIGVYARNENYILQEIAYKTKSELYKELISSGIFKKEGII